MRAEKNATSEWLDGLVAEGGLDAAVGAALALQGTSTQRLYALRYVSQALLDAKRVIEVSHLLEMAQLLQPKQGWVERMFAEVRASEGDVAGQVRHLGLAFSLDPADSDIGNAYVNSLLQSGRYSEAEQVFREHVDHARHAHGRLLRWEEPARKSLDTLDGSSKAIRMYLDLLELTVSNWIYGDMHNQLGQLLPFDPETRAVGRDIPSQAHTMIGLRRLRHLRLLVEQALEERIPGDFVETGIWRGGACILMAGVLSAYGVGDRHVVAADSFAGLPAPDVRYPEDELSTFDFHLREELSVSLETVRANFKRYDLLSEQVVFLKGLFRDTLPSYPYGPIAVLRLDCDLYSSTMDVLVHLYPRVVPGGWIICDDYGVVIDARRAVLDFRSSRSISAPMIAVDGDAVFWRKH